MYNLINQTVKNILEAKYVKISFNRNSVCMGDDCNLHNEYIKFVADKTTMLDIVNHLKNLVPYTGGKKQGVFTLSVKLAEKNDDFIYVLGAYYETDEYCYSYAIEPQKTIKMILEDFYNEELQESVIFDYFNKGEHFCDTSKQDGIPSFIKIYASVGTSGDEVPFEDLKCYLAELVNKYQKQLRRA